MNQPPKYRFYPSLLDKFEQYLRADEQVESFWNVDNETGEYKKSPEKYKGHVGDVSTVIRIAVTSRTNTPDLCAIMKILGKDETESRIADAINYYKEVK